MNYALLLNGTFVRYEWFESTPPVLSASKGLTWVPYQELPDPAFDPSTQRLGDVAVTVVNGTAIAQRQVIALTPAEITAHNAAVADQAAAQARQVADEAARTAAKAEAVIQYLVTHTPAECHQYIQDNVTTLAQAKVMMGRMAMALCFLARRELR